MKKLLYSLFVVVIQFTAFNTFSQEATKDGIMSDLDTYQELFSAQDFDSLLYYVNPKVFEILPKEMFVNVMASMFQSDEMSIEINEFTPTYIMDVNEIEERTFSFVEYNLEMDMIYAEGFEDEEEASFMQDMLELSYGEGNVEVNQEKGLVSLTVPSTMFAEYLGDRWTFTRYDSSQQGLLNQVLGKEIQDRILKIRYTEEEPVTQ